MVVFYGKASDGVMYIDYICNLPDTICSTDWSYWAVPGTLK